MHLLFLIPLLLGLVAGYISQSADTEIAYLTTTISIVSLFASIIIAPWQIQLLILLIVMVGAKQLWQRNENKFNLEISELEQTQQSSQENNSQRKYRGVSYQKTTSEAQNVDNTTVRKYRGITWIKSVPANSPAKPKSELKYRGNSVTTQPDSPKS
ncbi:hypothetical protein Sta7437_3776 [Stanieria cyanosphaera PCC 7437]|uniref:DUF4278 domain-containing protein n=1 Tax=Stanieria cyanosphaera (strain ATCC 29371 / PCC 7437) TaxID=111780 RepID=K9XXL8_STAC7|nr:DUF4278 domain-containing protein [Stanieria cyanosphaera]AFZ37268.1 hypothetical protein Sta7437_3776 [Stanieria cyanosphaera PCC 7437]